MKKIILMWLFTFQLCFAQGLTHILEIQPPFSENRILGVSILGVGDVNGDGWPDLAVGAGGPQKTFFYWGGPGILDTTADFSIPYVGSVMRLADLNGDGKEDLILSARDTVRVFFGKNPPPIAFDTMPGLILHGETLDDFYGGRAVAVGDLNRDRFGDLVVGAETYTIGGRGFGKVYVYLGKSVPTTTADFTVVGDSLSGFGVNVQIGDLDGDSYADLAVASRRAVQYPHEDQSIRIWRGGPSLTFSKNNYSQEMRKLDSNVDMYLFTLIDYNLDGKADIFYPDSGRAFFHWGRTDSVRYAPDLIINPFGAFTHYFTNLVFSIGDVNKDGISDFAFQTTPGGGNCVSVFLGNPPGPMITASGSRCRTSQASFWQITGVGDINGDGVGDFASSDPYFDDPGGSLPQPGYVVIFSGNKDWTSVSDPDSPCPCDFELSQNYPNPFNPSTTIQYSLAASDHVEIRVLDVLGRTIRTLVNRIEQPGAHAVVWNGRNNEGLPVAAGVYFYQLIVAGEASQTRKLVLLR
jgi:hypothetical protein